MQWSNGQILGSFVLKLTNEKYFTWERTMNNVATQGENMSSDRVSLEKLAIVRDLGVQVDMDLRFSQHVETQVNNANRMLGLMRRSYEHIDAEKYSYCLLHLEFGHVVWSPRLEQDKKPWKEFSAEQPKSFLR